LDSTAFDTEKLAKQTALLNTIQQKGIPITDAVRQKVASLAEQYAKFKIAADVSTAINATTADIDKQRAAVADQTKLVGLYGDALARATREQEAQRRLRDSLPKGEIVVMPNITGALSDDIDAGNRAARAEKLRKDAEDSAYAMDLERNGLGLTGAAALSYSYVVDQLNQRKREGIALSPGEVAAIQAAGDAYGQQRYAIDQAAQGIADAREVTKGFASDAINGLRETGNAFKSLADAATNALNRIIDKLLDKALDGFLNNMFPSSSSRMQTASLATIASNPAIFAKGGTFGAPQRFANGGAFTNTVVNTPTLFRFANGAGLGEMGEAGPEAIMPLKRGPNGSLGVQMHGGSGKPAIRMGDVVNNFNLTGGPDERTVAAMRQMGEATIVQMKRDLQSTLQQLDQDGAFSS